MVVSAQEGGTFSIRAQQGCAGVTRLAGEVYPGQVRPGQVDAVSGTMVFRLLREGSRCTVGWWVKKQNGKTKDSTVP